MLLVNAVAADGAQLVDLGVIELIFGRDPGVSDQSLQGGLAIATCGIRFGSILTALAQIMSVREK